MRGLLAAFDAGTADAIRAFIAGQLRRVRPARRSRSSSASSASAAWRTRSGRSSSSSVLQTEPARRSRSSRVRRRSGDWFEVGMLLEPAPDVRASWACSFEAVGGARRRRRRARKGSDAEVRGGAPTRVSDADRRRRRILRRRPDRARTASRSSTRPYGLADRDFGVPNRPDTKFNLGSINKIFTQVAIAQLAEQGKLALSGHDPQAPARLSVARRRPDHDPAAPRRCPRASATSSARSTTRRRRPKLRTLADYLPLFVDEPLLFEPGTSRSYSNAGYVVLGLIIEKVSGKSYYDYVRRARLSSRPA